MYDHVTQSRHSIHYLLLVTIIIMHQAPMKRNYKSGVAEGVAQWRLLGWMNQSMPQTGLGC